MRTAIVALLVSLLLALAAAVAGGAAAAEPDAVAWGSNQVGQLGDGADDGSDVPVQISGLAGVISLTGGAEDSFALVAGGSVYGWGANQEGQLGNGEEEPGHERFHFTPQLVQGLNEVQAFSTGGSHSLALLTSGTVDAWGQNDHGQLGNGSTEGSGVPVPVPGLSGVSAVAAGERFSLALLANGTVEAWGDNAQGELGDGTTTDSHVPVSVPGLSEVVAIAAHRLFSLALLANGTVEAWGDDELGQLGDGRVINSDTPVAVTGLTEEATAIAAGESFALALLRGGTVEAWGSNRNGQLGDGSFAGGSATAVAVEGISGVTALAAGQEDGYALLGDGKVMAWGDDGVGQLGNGTKGGAGDEARVPVAVGCGLSGVSLIGAGEGGGFAAGPLLSATCPVVTGVTPEEGPSFGGNTVTISGQRFSAATAVKFGSVEATSFTAESPNTIEAVAPPGSEGRVDITVTADGETSETTADDHYTYFRGPFVESVHPNTDSVGATVTLSGGSFDNVSAVDFGSTPATSFHVEEGQGVITAVVPAGSGTANITVTRDGYTSPAASGNLFAYAQPPEFGRCLSTSQGAYSKSTCAALALTGSFEWFQAFGIDPLSKTGFTTKSSGKVALASTGGMQITCSAAGGAGDYSGNRTVALSSLTFTGCEQKKPSASCQSAGAHEGEIQTSALTGELGIVKVGASAAKDKLGLQLGRSGGDAVAEFSCDGVPVTLRGSVIFEVKGNKMASSSTWKASESKGSEKVKAFEGSTEAELEAKVGAGGYERAGLTLSNAQSNEEAIEIDSAV